MPCQPNVHPHACTPIHQHRDIRNLSDIQNLSHRRPTDNHNSGIYAHALAALRAVIFFTIASTALVSYAMDNASPATDAPPTISPVSLSELLCAERTNVAPLLDNSLAHLVTTKEDKLHLQKLLMGAAQAGDNKKNSPIRIRFVIQLLLARGADPLEPDKFGATPFSQSCYISSYPIVKNIICRLIMGKLDPNYCPNPQATPLLWQMLERVNKYSVYRLVQAALESDANPDTLNAQNESLLDRFLPKKQQFVKTPRYPEYGMLVCLLYRYGATTKQQKLHDYFNEQEAKEIEQERAIYLEDKAYLLAAYSPELRPALSQKQLEELYVLALQERVPVQTPKPVVNLIASYSGNNSFVIRRTPTL